MSSSRLPSLPRTELSYVPATWHTCVLASDCALLISTRRASLPAAAAGAIVVTTPERAARMMAAGRFVLACPSLSHQSKNFDKSMSPVPSLSFVGIPHGEWVKDNSSTEKAVTIIAGLSHHHRRRHHCHHHLQYAFTALLNLRLAFVQLLLE